MSFEKGLLIEKGNTTSLESKIYNFVNELEQYIPIPNDRNRLSYDLLKQKRNEGDSTEIVVKKNKLQIVGITREELISKIDSGIKELN